jgi:hypothetical protein
VFIADYTHGYKKYGIAFHRVMDRRVYLKLEYTLKFVTTISPHFLSAILLPNIQNFIAYISQMLKKSWLMECFQLCSSYLSQGKILSICITSYSFRILNEFSVSLISIRN